MKKCLFLIFLLCSMLCVQGIYAQQKYALVIGNGAYTNFGTLRNAVNDANDMETALHGLGFTVDKVLNGSLNQMETAIIRLKNRLSASKNSYGFIFYAGHGLQSNGVNFLIPATANIPDEGFLRDRAVSVQSMLAVLNDAGNALNIVVMDACRDFPAAWNRSSNRGLSVVSNQPADSIIVFATSAGSVAEDGKGRNGLFTGQLLNHLKTPGLEIAEVFRLTGASVSQESNRRQIPAVYNQFFGTAYLAGQPVATPAQTATPASIQPAASPAQSTRTYQIGDTGPAGGIIFFDKGRRTDSWRYLEVAPTSTEFTAQWGAYDKLVSGTQTGIGTGRQNTQIIVRFLGNSESGRAAQLCASLNFGGFSDWFLPSIDELNIMYKNLKNKGFGGFGSDSYWSSSQGYRDESDNLFAFVQNLNNGWWGSYMKHTTQTVRAIRAF